MKVLKLGLSGFLLTMVLNISLLAISDGHSEFSIFVISIIGHILLLLLWYILINISLKDSLKSSILVTIFYLIPYSILMLIAISAMQNQELKNIYYGLIYVIYIRSFFIPTFMQNKFIYIYIYQVLNIIILLIINIIRIRFSTIHQSRR